MKPKVILTPLALLTASAIAALFCGQAGAVVIVNDDFEDGLADDAGNAFDLSWGPASNATTLSVDNAATAPGTGNYLQVNNTSNFGAFRGTLPNNPRLSISIGETLNLSFSLFYNTAPASTGNGLRFGLLNSADNGIGVVAGTGTNTAIELKGDFDATDPTVFGGSNAFNLSNHSGAGDSRTNGTMSSGLTDGVIYSVLYTITRTTADTLTASSSINGGTATVTDFNNTPDTDGTQGNDYITDFTNGAIYIRSGSQAANYRIDNVFLEVVPEPSTALLGAIGCLALLRRRR